jgi:hypothetical protein
MTRPGRLAATFITLVLASGCAVQQTAGPAAVVAPPANAEPPIALPMRDGSLRFAVLGDAGTGGVEQYALAATMARMRQSFPFTVVLMTGDNIYGSQDMEAKFARPYKPLIDAGVKFYASLGNHDSRNQRFYKLFNMDGRHYYSFKAPDQDVRFFALESTYPAPEQIAWVEEALKGSGEDWKVAFFHHPLYSSGGRHGSDLELRAALEPIFVRHNVSVVFTGHDHFYERIKPQQGIVHFVVGSGGKLALGDIAAGSSLTARGFDRDCAFLMAEIVDDQMFFNAVSRQGDIVDSGIVLRRQAVESTASAVDRAWPRLVGRPGASAPAGLDANVGASRSRRAAGGTLRITQ